MCDSDVQTGDHVSWNWGGEHPTGVEKKMGMTGSPENEPKSKQVHKSADPDNPAAHVEGGSVQDIPGEAVVQGVQEVQEERGEVKEAKKTGRGGRKGGRQAPVETRKKQSEGGRKGGAAAGTKKAAAGRKRGKVKAEEAEVGEKREREGVAEERIEREGEDISMEKGEKEKVEVTQVGLEEEKAEKEAGKGAKRAKISPEQPEGEYVQVGEEEDAEGAEEEETPKEKEVETTGPTPGTEKFAGASEELKELERDNLNLGLDVGAVGSQPRFAAQTALEGIAMAAAVAASSTARTGTGEEPPKKGGKRGGARGRA